MELVFSASSVNLFPDVIEDGNEPIELVEGTDLDDIEIDRIMCFSLGRRKSRPHLLVGLVFSSFPLDLHLSCWLTPYLL